jgi:hypothetical protein
MASTEREWFADSPAGFFEWIERTRPEWAAIAKEKGGYLYVPGFEDAYAAWDAAICAAMKHIHETPIRELHDKVYSLRVGPPMA